MSFCFIIIVGVLFVVFGGAEYVPIPCLVLEPTHMVVVAVQGAPPFHRFSLFAFEVRMTNQIKILFIILFTHQKSICW